MSYGPWKMDIKSPEWKKTFVHSTTFSGSSQTGSGASRVVTGPKMAVFYAVWNGTVNRERYSAWGPTGYDHDEIRVSVTNLVPVASFYEFLITHTNIDWNNRFAQ
jgi:hypothetical protein